MMEGSYLTVGRITKQGQHEIQLIKKAKASVICIITISSGFMLPVIILDREEGKGEEEVELEERGRERRGKKRGGEKRNIKLI